MNTDDPLIDGLMPLVSRLRTDVSAVRRPGKPAAWTDQKITRERLAQHLNGGPARGVCPIREGESVTMVGLLDFDSHRGEVSWAAMSEVVARVADTLEMVYGMEPMLFRSSGGNGVHLYVMWEVAQDAYSVRQFLGRVLVSCGLKAGTKGVAFKEVEVFPRQNEVAVGKLGNMAILPLANRSVPLALSDEGDALW